MQRSMLSAVALAVLKSSVVVGLYAFLAPRDPRDLLFTSVFIAPGIVFGLALALASSFEGTGPAQKERPVSNDSAKA